MTAGREIKVPKPLEEELRGKSVFVSETKPTGSEPVISTVILK
jgi:hypothetical protein